MKKVICWLTTCPIKAISVVVLCGIAAIFPGPVASQVSKVYLQPALSIGLISGYDKSNALKLDMGHPGYYAKLELRGGYYLNSQLSIFTGLGFGIYNYRMKFGNGSDKTMDTVRQQDQDILEIPLGIRYTTFNGRSKFKTRYYFGGGVMTSLLNDARSSYHRAPNTGAGSAVRNEDFNNVYLRLFAEGGLDIPMDYSSAILVGLSVSNGITRNMSRSGDLADSNYGALVGALSVGLRLGL